MGTGIGFNADLYPTFYLNADPDPESRTNAEPDSDPGQIQRHKKWNFYIKNIPEVCNRSQKHSSEGKKAFSKAGNQVYLLIWQISMLPDPDPGQQNESGSGSTTRLLTFLDWIHKVKGIFLDLQSLSGLNVHKHSCSQLRSRYPPPSPPEVGIDTDKSVEFRTPI